MTAVGPRERPSGLLYQTHRSDKSQLFPGMYLVLGTDGISVLKIDDNGKAVKVAVKTGVAADDMMEVVGGETRD